MACPTTVAATLAMRDRRQQPRGRAPGHRDGSDAPVRSQTASDVGRNVPSTVAARSCSRLSRSTWSRSRSANDVGHLLAVVTGAVESAVDGALDPSAERLEQRKRHERGHRDGKGVLPGHRGEHGLEDHDAADEHRHEDGRHHRPPDRAADEPVDVVQAVAEDGDPHRDRDPGRRDERDDEQPVAAGRDGRDQAGEECRGREQEPAELLPLNALRPAEAEQQRRD